MKRRYQVMVHDERRIAGRTSLMLFDDDYGKKVHSVIKWMTQDDANHIRVQSLPRGFRVDVFELND